MPMKPVKRGIKIWVLADATNGYISAMQVYTGKKDGGVTEPGLGYRVVTDLVRDLQGKKYHIVITFSLLSYWLEICLTDFPADLKPNKQEVKALRHGESVYRRQGNIGVTVWKEKTFVFY